MSILIKNTILDKKETDLLIKDNTITKIAPNVTDPADKIINAKNKAVIPSFINSHTHAAMNLFKGYADDMDVMHWLQEIIWPLEEKLTEEDVYWGTKLACLEMIKSGTTCFNDMYWHFHGTAKAADEMGLRAIVASVFIDFFDPKKANDQKEECEKLFQESRKYSDRIKFSLGPHAIYTVSKDSLIWIKDFADKNNLLIHIHLSETQTEAENCVKQYNLRPCEYLANIGFLGPNVIAAHSIWLTESEIALLAKHNVKIVHNPVSNMKLASGIFPYKKLSSKVKIALGTDGCASNNNLDMFEEMKFASLLQKTANMQPTMLPAKETLDLATKNPAEIFNLNCSKIEVGMIADLLLIDLNKINIFPDHNLVSNLVYAANSSIVDTTICNGKILMENRKIDGEEEIKKQAIKTLTKLIDL
jgi:5-methylthioadenosine/S-adenosylhomocysteine deaminase